jgi:hypothetical protein
MKTQIGLVQKIINELKPQFNDFKTPQDRKYAIYEILQHGETPFKIEKYQGSNQIIVYQNDTEIYNSNTETKEQTDNFEAWFKKLLTIWLIVNLPDGI